MVQYPKLDLNDEPAFTTGQAARYMEVAHSTLNKWRRQGRAPAHITLSWRKFLWRRADLDAFMAARRVQAAPATSNSGGEA